MKKLLIDADTMAVTACIGEMVEVEEDERDDYQTEQGWRYVNDSTHGTFIMNVEQAYTSFLENLNELKMITCEDDYELHFTFGKCFRFDIEPNYKKNRVGNRPILGIKEIKQLIKDRLGDKVFLHETIEADDAVCYLKNTYPNKYLLCAIDKDVLMSCEGEHFDYYYGRYSFVTTSALDVLLNPYKQGVKGDSVDNIKGAFRVGEKKVEEMFKGCTTKKDAWSIALNAFKYAGTDKFTNDLLKYRLAVDKGDYSSLVAKEVRQRLKDRKIDYKFTITTYKTISNNANFELPSNVKLVIDEVIDLIEDNLKGCKEYMDNQSEKDLLHSLSLVDMSLCKVSKGVWDINLKNKDSYCEE